MEGKYVLINDFRPSITEIENLYNLADQELAYINAEQSIRNTNFIQHYADTKLDDNSDQVSALV